MWLLIAETTPHSSGALSNNRKGISAFIGKSGDSICPVAALSPYLAMRGSNPGPLFWLTDLSPLTIIKLVQSALSSLGYDPASYTSPGFHIGAATTAAEHGVEDSVIKALGWWKSDASQAYFKIPRDRLASLAPLLSGH